MKRLFSLLFAFVVSTPLVSIGSDDPSVDPVQEITQGDAESGLCAGALSPNKNSEPALQQFAERVGKRLDSEDPVDAYLKLRMAREEGIALSRAILADPIQSMVFEDLQWVMRVVQLLRQHNYDEAKSQLYGLFDPVQIAVRDILKDSDDVQEYRELVKMKEGESRSDWIKRSFTFHRAKAAWNTRRLLKRLEKNMKYLGRMYFRYNLIKQVLNGNNIVNEDSDGVIGPVAEGETPEAKILKSLGFNSRFKMELQGKIEADEQTPSGSDVGVAFSTRVEDAGDESAKQYMLKYRRLAGIKSVFTRFLSQPYLWKIIELTGSLGVGVHQQFLDKLIPKGGKVETVNETLLGWADDLRMVGKSVWVRNTDMPEIFYIIYAIPNDLPFKKFDQFREAFNRRGKGFVETFALVDDRDANRLWDQMLEIAEKQDPTLAKLMRETQERIAKQESEGNFNRMNLFAARDRITPAVQVLAPIGMLAYMNSGNIIEGVTASANWASLHLVNLWDMLHMLF